MVLLLKDIHKSIKNKWNPKKAGIHISFAPRMTIDKLKIENERLKETMLQCKRNFKSLGN